jgi:hypothetical protein
LNLIFTGSSETTEGTLNFSGRVLNDAKTLLLRRKEDHASRFAKSKRTRCILCDKRLFNRDHGGAKSGKDRPQTFVQTLEALFNGNFAIAEFENSVGDVVKRAPLHLDATVSGHNGPRIDP